MLIDWEHVNYSQTVQKVETECKKLNKAQENKMACSSRESDDILIQSLKENAMNKNTL